MNADNLMAKYEVSRKDVIYACIIRKIRGTSTPSKNIYKYSLNKYGLKDNFARYYTEKYSGYSVGKYTSGYQHIRSSLIKSIGAFCSIAINQQVVRNSHRLDYVTTWDVDTKFVTPQDLDHTITIGNDVWIGNSCTIMNGVTIGDGAVLGAGSIVTRDVPPYAVIINANEILRYRFSEDIIKQFLEIKWWNWPDEKIFANFKWISNPRKFLEEAYKNGS